LIMNKNTLLIKSLTHYSVVDFFLLFKIFSQKIEDVRKRFGKVLTLDNESALFFFAEKS